MRAASLSAVLLLFSSAASAFSVKSVSPKGETPNVRQFTATFSEAMVAFGDPNAAAPLETTCAALGVGRWVDPKSWIFDFKKDLPAGVSCEFKLAGGVKALKGSGPEGPATFTFNTGGPQITDSNPYRWGVPEDAIFVLTLNSDYDPKSLEQHAWVQAPGIASKIGVSVVTGSVREQILAQEFRYQEQPDPERLKRTVLLKPQQSLPAGKQVQLVFGQGVATASGVARSKAQKWDYEVREAFRATFDCERENADAGCVPFTPVSLRLSAEVAKELAAKITLTGSVGGEARLWKPKLGEEDTHVSSVTFKGPFPDNAKLVLTLPENFKDDAGRTLANKRSFPLTVRTAGYPPLAKFAAPFGIVEAHGAPPALPVTVRNVEANLQARIVAPVRNPADKGVFTRWYDRLKGWIFRIPRKDAADVMDWLDRLMAADREKSLFDDAEAAKNAPTRTIALDHKEAKSFEVVGLPLGGPGFYLVELASKTLGDSLLGKSAPMYVQAGALVTNLAVHAKLADERSLIWVTSLDRGQPVDGALVSIWDCNKKLYFKARTNRQGWALVDEPLPPPDKAPTCGKKHTDYSRGYLIAAEKGDDFSFVHTSWDRGIETWRFNLPYVDDYGGRDELAAHTVLDRTLLRAGETTHMKTILRRRALTGFGAVDRKDRPEKLVAQHMGSEQKYSFDLSWDDAGVTETEWKIPADAKLGTYQLYLVRGKEDSWENQLPTGELRVEEFRIPLAKGTVDGGASVLVAPKELRYALGVRYLSGGGAGNQPVRFRARLIDRAPVDFPDYEGYVFATEPLKAGLSRRDTGADDKPVTLKDEDLTLDGLGTATVVLPKPPMKGRPAKVETELEYKDPSGEIQTVTSTQTLWPAPVVVGIRPESWALSKADVRLRVVALDQKGKPIPDREVAVRVFKRKYLSHRKRLVGGFYAYDSATKLTPLGELCKGKTEKSGEFVCTGTVKQSGELMFEAYSKAGGATVTAAASAYIGGNDDWFFAQENDDRIDVIPEKRSYEPGETAKLQIRMPFRKAIALVTVEREGVADVYVKKLSGKKPVIGVPVKDAYAPNTYISVLVVRGRTKQPEAGFLADLAKPAYKLGIAKLAVGLAPFKLDVKVSTDKATYQARDEVEAEIVAKPADGKDLGGKAEAAIAVVDEGLLELKRNDSWQLLGSMMGTRGEKVRTYTAASQVIGKRHFGLKSLADGGGGGMEVTRTMFDPLVYWQGRLKLDGDGKGKVKFKLNDSLTSFKVVAVAQAGLNRFGTGSASIASTKDVMVLAGLPQVARGGDKLKAAFTLRNTTKAAKELEAALAVDGLAAKFPAQRATLGPGEAKEVGWTIAIPKDAEKLSYDVTVSEGGETKDKLAVAQKVVAAVPVRTVQATLVSLDKPLQMTVARPEGADEGRGGIAVTLKRSLAGSFPSLERYMRDYPYTCMEQRLSRAVALSSDEDWAATTAVLPSYLDAQGFLKYYPSSLDGSVVLTAYALTLAHEAGRTLPESAQQQMLTALAGFVDGSILGKDTSFGADLTMRKLSAIDALSRYGQATGAMLGSFEHDPDLWPTSALIDWIGILGRVKDVAKGLAKRDEALDQLRSRLTFRGTEMGFSTEMGDKLWWLMVSVDLNAVRTILLALEQDVFKEDLPKIVKGALARQGQAGHWDLTTANALGTVALAKFAKAFESKSVKGETVATLGGDKAAHDWGKDSEGGTVSLKWPGAAKKTLTVKQEGDGKPWAIVESRAAVPLKEPVASGFTVTREVKPIRVKTPGAYHVGDIIRVKVSVDSQSDMGLVVVDDPIPAGASILGTGLGNSSQSATEGEKGSGWAWPIYRENAATAMRAYYDFVPKGGWSLEYTLRLNNAGTFRLPPTHVEAMYAPDTYGEVPNATVTVKDDEA